MTALQTISGEIQSQPLNDNFSLIGQDFNAHLNDTAKVYINVMSPPTPLTAAKGDGATDDTPAIQACINYLTKGGIIFFPPGKYKVTDTLLLGDGTTLLGAGSNRYQTRPSSTLTERYVSEIFNTDNSEPVIESLGKYSGNKNNIIKIMSLKISGNHTTTMVIDMKGFWNSLFDDVAICDGIKTINLESDIGNGYTCYFNKFLNCYIAGENASTTVYHNNYGIHCQNYAQECIFTNVIISSCGNGLYIESGSYVHASFVNIEYTVTDGTKYPLYIDSADSVIGDVRIDPHYSMSNSFIGLGINSKNNMVKGKLQVSQGFEWNYFVKDLGKRNDIQLGNVQTLLHGKIVIKNKECTILDGSGNPVGFTLNNVSYSQQGYLYGHIISRFTNTSGDIYAKAVIFADIPYNRLKAGTVLRISGYFCKSGEGRSCLIMTSGGFISIDGSTNNANLHISSSEFTYAQVLIRLESDLATNLAVEIYPSRDFAGGTNDPAVGDYIDVAGLNLEVIDTLGKYERSIKEDGSVGMLNDLSFNNAGQGIIVKTPDGTKLYRVSVDNSGALTTTLI
jgi:hypothetical protein